MTHRPALLGIVPRGLITAGALAGALLATACIESNVNGRTNTDGDTGDTGVDVDPRGDVDTWPPINGEYCNGVDDNGDGQIDEGFPDTDGDGLADCIDDDCDLELPGPGSIPIDESCSAQDSPHDFDPWDVTVQWRWEGVSVREQRFNDNFPKDYLYANILMAPIVGNLTDDNFDGVIDRSDMPDIVTVAFVDPDDKSGLLVVLDGETGEMLLQQKGWLPFGGIVVADIDRDGETEIVGFDDQSRPKAIRMNGTGEPTVLWLATDGATSDYPQATVADLDGDGRVEVLADNLVLDGATGERLFRASIDSQIIGRMPAVGDIDLDGLQEFAMGRDVYQFDRRSGTVEVTKEWTTPVRGTYGHWTAILDANGDLFGEVAMIGDGRLVIHKHNGPILVDVAAGTDQPGPPCIADFDGDGISEIAWGSSDSFNVYELDGTKVWTFPMSDQSGLAACSGYDFDADGAYEVVFGDEQAMYIFDGKTGRIRYGNLGHASGTVFEYPVIADVDRDGSAEIVLASSNYRLVGWAGITVFSQAENGWARSGPTWHVHDFAVTNITEDGVVPASPEPSWQIHNVYRARPSSNETFVDLQAAIVDVCWSGCKGDAATAKIAVRAYNSGSSTSRSQVPIALYARSGDRLELLAVKKLRQRVPAGGASAGILFEVAPTAAGTDGFLVRINDDGSGGMEYQEECDLNNNEGVWTDSPCTQGGAE